MLEDYEEKYGRKSSETTPKLRFGGIIDRAYRQTGQQVVVLIDEYDLPIINNIHNPALEKANRSDLKDFYGVMKSMDAKLRFVLLTGVGKLGHLSVFSDLNNLRDITLNPVYSTICGITKEELHLYFDEGIQELADAKGWTKERTYAELKIQYDGYHFAENLKDVYNPFSILNCLADNKIKDYWFQTGTPSHLFHILRNSKEEIAALNGSKITESALTSADVIAYNPVTYMFYTGYLTIKAYRERYSQFTLGYPNREVENGFVGALLPIITDSKQKDTTNLILQCADLIDQDRIDDFLEALRAFFAKIPYDLESRNEFFYQNVIYCVATLLGCYVQAEYHTSKGRIDLVIGSPTTVYIMELKLDGSPLLVLDQIDRRHYALPFALDGRRVVKIGVNFSSDSRTIDSWIMEE